MQPDTLYHAAREAELFAKTADAIRRGLDGDPSIRQVVVSTTRREIVIVAAPGYEHVALRAA